MFKEATFGNCIREILDDMFYLVKSYLLIPEFYTQDIYNEPTIKIK
jgi:hypothetical protein